MLTANFLDHANQSFICIIQPDAYFLATDEYSLSHYNDKEGFLGGVFFILRVLRGLHILTMDFAQATAFYVLAILFKIKI